MILQSVLVTRAQPNWPRDMEALVVSLNSFLTIRLQFGYLWVVFYTYSTYLRVPMGGYIWVVDARTLFG
jgi:hypothetical protein